jgi:hypothetical protein
MAKRLYYNQEGVRRALVAREEGWTNIFATVHNDGRPDYLARIPLDELYSPKSFVPRDSRSIVDVEYPPLVTGSPMPAINVEPRSSQSIEFDPAESRQDNVRRT